jgi:hypothetical protein
LRFIQSRDLLMNNIEMEAGEEVVVAVVAGKDAGH